MAKSLGSKIESGFRELVRRFRGSRPVGEMVLVSSEATLKAHQAEPDRVVLTSLLDGRRLFSVEGRLEAALTRVEGGGDTTLRLPVRTQDGRGWIRVRVSRTAPPGEWPALRRVRAVAVPEGLEFQFRSDSAPESAEISLEFTFDPTLRISEFRPFEDLQPLFRELPGVPEMAAYLRACMHHRRSQLQILSDLADSLRSARIQDGVDLMRRRRTAVLMNTWTLSELATRLSARKHEMSPTVLGAACLAAELEARTLGLDALAAMLADAVVYDPSAEILAGLENALVARLRGDLLDDPADSPRDRALARVAQALTQDSALRVLSDLAAQSRAGTAASVARLLRRGLRESARLSDESQEALRTLLARAGRAISSGTMAGLCLFVEAELGLITWEQMEELLTGGVRPPTTAYALAAVAGACDLELRGFRVERDLVPSLIGLSEGQALVQQGDHFHVPGGEETPAPVVSMLVHLPVLDNLQMRDLEVLAASGHTVHSCYRSSVHRHLVWADRLEPDAPFAGRVLGWLRRAAPEDLEGQESVITAWSDQRGQISFRHHATFRSADVRAEGEERWTGEIVEFPAEGLPPVLAEMNRHELSGIEDPRRLPPGLVELKEALDGLGEEGSDSLHHHPRLLSSVRLGLVSPALVRLLCDSADRRTREAILEAARRPDGIREELVVHPSLLFLLELTETVETGLLATAASLAPTDEAEPLFRSLVPRLREHSASGQSAVRWATARLLGTRLGQVLMEDALAILRDLRLDESRGVAGAATASLVALALAPSRPTPPLVQIRPGRVDRKALWAEESQRLTSQVMDHVRGYVMFPQDRSPGASHLVREEEHGRRPHRARIEALCRLVAGVNLALATEMCPSTLEVRPSPGGGERQAFEIPAGGPCGPWSVAAEGAGMADRTRFSAFFEHLCKVAAEVPVEDLEILRQSEGAPGHFDRTSLTFHPMEIARPNLVNTGEDLRQAARRLVQRLALAPNLEEQVLRLLVVQWNRLQPHQSP